MTPVEEQKEHYIQTTKYIAVNAHNIKSINTLYTSPFFLRGGGGGGGGGREEKVQSRRHHDPTL